jgi:hypothetical protein
MRLGEPGVVVEGATARISCEVELEGTARTWWIDAPASVAGRLDPGPTAFFPLALMLAARLGEDLHVDAPLCETQLKAGFELGAVFERWWGWRTPEIVGVSAPVRQTPAGSVRGLLFSRGADSSAELVASRRGEVPPIGMLVSIEGIEPTHSQHTAALVAADTAAVARRLGVDHVALRTNLRVEADRHLEWPNSHGAVLVGTALALGPMLQSLVVAQPIAERTFRERRRPYGTSRELDPLWSTDGTAVECGDETRDRVAKVALVATEPELVSSLKVCWEADVRGNCGRCEKCANTMTALRLTGNGDLIAGLFDTPLSVERVRRIRSAGRPSGRLRAVVEVLRSLAVTAADDPQLAELASAWDEAAARGWGARTWGLAGLDPLTRLDDNGDRVALDDRFGWGGDARPLHLLSSARHGLVASRRGQERVLPWCQIDVVSPHSARLALTLAECVPGGASVLCDEVVPGAPAVAVGGLLDTSALRCWGSAEHHLEAVPLLEAVEHGCAPLQVVPDELVELIHGDLPAWARVLVVGIDELPSVPFDDARLDALWGAAIALVVAGSMERDARIGGRP